jgi:hypothetical protein
MLVAPSRDDSTEIQIAMARRIMKTLLAFQDRNTLSETIAMRIKIESLPLVSDAASQAVARYLNEFVKICNLKGALAHKLPEEDVIRTLQQH